ncbi:MAG: membrane protein insertase YidC, partial [Alphaproteobacteria bacterium]|nr:membrane protein insertase YidC [Alphaproteobacteria bacterium]
KYQVDFLQPAITLETGENAETTSHIYTGVKKVLLLQEYGKKLNIPNFDLAVDFGWFWFLAKPFFYLLHFLSTTTGNFGIGLILLTIVARSAVFPLTNFSYKSFAKMKKVAPQVAELRKAYNDDKKKLQEELVQLYEREGVNPLSGCLPIMVQIPIFFSLYKVLITTIEMRHAPFYGWIHDLSAPDPTNVFTLFGLFDWTMPSFIHGMGVWPCLLMIMFYMQKTLAPPPQDPIQRDMMYYFPFLMAYLMAKFASGLVIYWTLSAAIGILQQIIIMKSMGVPIYLFGEHKEEQELEKEVDKGPALHPLVDMAEKKVEEALFPEKPVTPPKPKKKKKK